MTLAPHMLVTYQQLLSLSQAMLRLATDGRWDELIDTEVDYVSAVEKLAKTTQDVPLSSEALEQLRPVLRHILDNEAEVKRLLQGRMSELSDLVSQSSRQKSVNNAYGSMRGNVLFPQQDPL